MSARADAVRTFAGVAADGTDPDLLVAVVCWALLPGRSLDALRRRCRDEAEPCGGSAAAAVAAAAGDPPADLLAPATDVAAEWHRQGARVALVGDRGSPGRLGEGWPEVDAPILLAWRGTPPVDGPAVAVVGARRATGYGIGVAAWLAESAARAGARVVSGGAVGVDAAAHEAALEEPGGTTVVLGCGHAVAYPRVHARPGGLFDRVVDHGGSIVSELLPHVGVHPGTVRARNRIVAGLADAVVVVEGGEHSGALLTATAAVDRGRSVLAVPGDVRAPGSIAPHRLLAEGAAPCTDPGDLLDVLGTYPSAAGVEPAAGDTATLGPLPPEAQRELERAWPRPVRVDDLAARASLSPGRLLAALTRARVMGVVAESAEGVRLRHAPPPRHQP
ncbi:MAG TPA: DNA-processing protein DprA [Egicoccus sp.]|nr:DNA-processing protein DprA [Egicoccus sp.]HSK23546.1 DNA-processing protein DprA [Egicoccus sp.]